MRKSIVAAFVIAGMLVVGGVSGAVAGSMIGTKQIKNDAVRSVDIHDGTIEGQDLRQALRDRIGRTGARGPEGPRGVRGPEGPVGDPASDRLGRLAASAASPGLQTITKVGGTYSTNATELFTFDLPAAGVYLINANGYFDRLNANEAGYEAPPTDTYLQLTLRGDGGLQAGTCFTPAVSHAGYTETTCDTSAVVTVDGPTTVTVRGFGYNEDRSGFGGAPNSATPQFKVFAQASAVKVG